MMNQRDTLHRLLNTLFEAEPLAVLATSESDLPHASLVAVAASEDLRRLVFATPRHTRKYANLRANPQAALLVDNTTGKPSDFRDAMAVTASGLACEPQAQDAEDAEALLIGRHPHLQSFVKDDACAIMVMSVQAYCIVRQFQNVVIYNPMCTDGPRP